LIDRSAMRPAEVVIFTPTKYSSPCVPPESQMGHFSITRWKSVFTKIGFDAFVRAWQGSPARGPFAALRFQRSN
jgi:hypothetical protein